LTEGGSFPSDALATTCDKTVDGPLGCAAHFPEANDVDGAKFDGAKGARLRLPLPYRAFPGSLIRWVG
jgi:hypothetical protein